jgi:hypothetical protein
MQQQEVLFHGAHFVEKYYNKTEYTNHQGHSRTSFAILTGLFLIGVWYDVRHLESMVLQSGANGGVIAQ